ncbi:Alpha-N-acetylgalactosaminidase, partial [Trichinella pseudospiralis]
LLTCLYQVLHYDTLQVVASELSIFLRLMSDIYAFFVALVSILFESALRTFGAQNGLALTPPMGWISWLQFGCQTDCSKGLKNCFRTLGSGWLS